MHNIFEIGIIGMGPAGIGLALSLHNTSKIKNAVCFERGSYFTDAACIALSKDECCYSPSCSIISGIGGASTLSSGKISDFPAGSGLANFFDSKAQLEKYLNKIVPFFKDSFSLNKVDIDDKKKKTAQLFYEKQNIAYKYYDVYEFDGAHYRNFIQKTVFELKEEGLHLFDNAEVFDIKRDPDTSYFCVNVRTPDGEKQFLIKELVLATGALDIQDKLIEKVAGPTKCCFEIGVRIEAPSNVFGDTLTTHGDLKLKSGNGRTYCVTVNGKIISYQTGGLCFLEGCLEPTGTTGYTNLAILIKCTSDSVINDFIDNYRTLFQGRPIKQQFTDYINGHISENPINTTVPSAISGNINRLFPQTLNNNIKDFIKNVLVEAMGIPENAMTLVAPELKIIRNLQIDKNFELDNNFFVIGAATGAFRGILQSFTSGVRCGQVLIRR